jgi:hypothetical protein
MGSSKDVLELFAERDIRQLFSEYDGWNITPVTGLQSTYRVYQAERGRRGREEAAFIAVSFDPVLRDEIMSIFDFMPNGLPLHSKKYLLTPQATDSSSAPPHIRVLPMTAFAFTDGKLVWLTRKKNARRSFLEQIASV